MNPEVLIALLTGGLEVPTELPLEEDLEAGNLACKDLATIGLTDGFGAGGAFFTVATEAELFNELLELLKEALEVDLSTRNELFLFGVTLLMRLLSMGVRGSALLSLVAILFGMSLGFVGLL